MQILECVFSLCMQHKSINGTRKKTKTLPAQLCLRTEISQWAKRIFSEYFMITWPCSTFVGSSVKGGLRCQVKSEIKTECKVKPKKRQSNGFTSFLMVLLGPRARWPGERHELNRNIVKNRLMLSTPTKMQCWGLLVTLWLLCLVKHHCPIGQACSLSLCVSRRLQSIWRGCRSSEQRHYWA